MATDQELIDYYKNLLILQYRGKTKAAGQIEAFIKQVIANQLPLDVQAAFDLDTAVGDQLDVLGKYAGVQRQNGLISLDDPDFRIFIKLSIIKNNSGSSLYEIQMLINQFFEGNIFVFDYKTMRMSYYIDESTWSEDLATIAVEQDILPFPMAIERGVNIYGPSEILNSFFGFRTYVAPVTNASPFNTYDDYNTDWPWLLYRYGSFNAAGEYSLLTEDGYVLTQEDGDALYLG